MSFLRFVVPAEFSGKTLASAVLRIRTTEDDFAGSIDLQSVQTANNTWSEDALSWVTRSTSSGASLGTFSAPAAGTESSVVLTASFLQGLLNTSGTFSVTLSSSGDDSLWFWSSNHAANSYRPRLFLTFR